MVEYIAGEVMNHPTCETCKWKDDCDRFIDMTGYGYDSPFKMPCSKPVSYCSNHEEA